ncbi:hypothetical protein PVK62_12825 [Aliivibrio sp. S3MY1]|uniref:hypothetical protein n=1 Tax=unclassified Aliivibrio TaxID=2645654 RepID=UPI00237905E2|nr:MULTISPECIES: hypothetical protein [unclassified Aliivibrio]MDD9196707.1 hypothetical protein [Aliivibrio sp. S3MY1]MDD9199802.1 hypothetical protein [Aliivibrio sp. S2MY1]
MKNMLKKQVKKLFLYFPFLYGFYSFFANKAIRKRVSDIVTKLEKIELYSEVRRAELQRSELFSLLEYATEYTEYYKNIFDEKNIQLNSIDSFKKIPILTKSIIRANEKALLSRQFNLNHLSKRNTGGSTGKPLEFYVDKLSGANDNAHHWYLYSKMGYKKGDMIVSCGGFNLPEKQLGKNLFWLKNYKDCVWGEYAFSALYMTSENIHLYVDKLVLLRPSILRGYPSFWDSIATYILAHNIQMPFKVKGINLTAEMCSVSQRKNIEKAFNTLVYFEYGHTEMCLYCYTLDSSYIYQSSPIYGYIEIVDEHGYDVDVGEIGKVVVTGFNNIGMPFIRYDTGDLVELSYRNGGIVKFKKIIGRNQDFIVSKSGQKVFLTGLIFGQHLKAFSRIKHWQLIQNEIGIVNILIVKESTYDKMDEDEILKNFNKVTDVDLFFSYVDDIPLTKRGKHLFLINNLNGDFN